jgi:hypothetical protein
LPHAWHEKCSPDIAGYSVGDPMSPDSGRKSLN